MIFGNIDKLEEQLGNCSEGVRRALIYLRDTDFTDLPDGKYEICGDKVYAKLQRYRTKPVEQCRPEAHKKFIDVQFMVSGREELGWCGYSPDLRPVKAYDGRDDVAFFEELIPESRMVLRAGDFAVLYPHDVHRPQVAVDSMPGDVVKVVVKVAVDFENNLEDEK